MDIDERDVCKYQQQRWRRHSGRIRKCLRNAVRDDDLHRDRNRKRRLGHGHGDRDG
jgi:hypothetical protein